MKLATKGLLVVCVPLVFQLIIVGVLAILLWRAQEIAATEARAKDVISRCNHTTVDIANTMQSAFRTDRAAGMERRDLQQHDIDEVRKSIGALQDMLIARPEQARNVERLSQFSEKFIKLLIAAKAAEVSTDPNVHGTSEILEFRMLKTSLHLIDIFGNIIALEDRTHPEDPTLRKDARMMIRVWLLAACVITTVIGVVLAYFSSQTIRKPVERMVKNAIAMSTRQPLEPELQGKDELANLDRVLHSVNAAIEEALTSERNLINYAADLVFSIDRQGKFLSVNPFCKTMLGYEPEELIGTSVLKFIAADDVDQVKKMLSSNYKGRESLLFEIKMQGKTAVIETSWSAIYSQRDRTFFCVAHDITERKNVERLKQDFIAMISHDLRTPLMSVSSSINLVQSGATGEISEVVERELSSAERSVDHLIELVNDLLDFEKLEAGRMNFELVPLKISEVIDESVRLVDALAKERKVTIESPNRDLMVSGDQRKLIQVTVNLLSNALKHSPEGGVIKIQTREVGGMVECAIHDEGPGVPDEYAEKIFAPFEQISHRATAALGTGLGLAICKLVVEGHGGKIAVRHSDILQGSAFWYSLPPATPQPMSVVTASSVVTQ
ncbi:MAG: PAS domain S-box protein [Candidatus Melainabacteria bacterium]|nr:MAG: PAS domain S-box protein [Candidatus Melainabacteria bacterium]